MPVSSGQGFESYSRYDAATVLNRSAKRLTKGQAAVSERHQMAALLTGLEIALYMLNRLQVYLRYFVQLPVSKAASNFEEVLVRFYATILDFLGRAIHTFQQKSATRACKSFWRPEDYHALEHKCKEIGQEADADAYICERELAAEDRQHTIDQLRNALGDIEKLREIVNPLNNLHKKFDLSRLPVAEGAAFDSFEEGQNIQCLQETRVKLMQDIEDWVNNPESKPIYWINGMAGTGKSTISRTVACNLQKQGRLGASFFFRRDKADRRDASRLLTTLAAQLAENVPSIRQSVFNSLDKYPDILQKTPTDHLEHLILTPLTDLPYDERIFIVIDALDECDRKDVRVVFLLLRQLSQSNFGARIRLFVTSRPEYLLLVDFLKIKVAYQDMILHEIAQSDIEHDIDVYFRYHFQRLREDRSHLPLIQQLAPDWPGADTRQTLVRRAFPLFIFAATICRLIADPTSDPDTQLLRILQQRTGSTRLEQTYMPVFQQLVDSAGREEKAVVQNCMDVLAPIITFAEPLSVVSMSKLLQLKAMTISQRLSILRPVLNVPDDPSIPVQIFHRSFRDFLTDPDRYRSFFWVNEQQTHDILATKCLQFLINSDQLKENICNQESLNVKRSDVRNIDISSAIPAEVAYACRYWVHHLQETGQSLIDDGTAHRFLRTHLLHWIEALSWLGNLPSVVSFLNSLRNLTHVSGHHDV